MKRQARRIIAATTFAALTLAFAAHAQFVGIGASSVQFQAVGPGGLKIDGSGGGLTVKESDAKLTVKAPLAGLQTGIGLRDKHMKKYLNVSQHPDAQLVVGRSSLKLPEDNKTVEGSATGQFTLNGKTKPVPFSYKAKRTGSDYHVQGLAEIDITEFGIEQPCYLGVCVDPKVKVKTKFKLRDK